MITLQAFGFDVESYDKTTCDGEIVTARLARKNARLRDVDFFVLGEAKGFDAVVHELEKLWPKGSAERGILLTACEYSRQKPYTLFDGFLNVNRLHAVYADRLDAVRRVVVAAFETAHKLKIDDLTLHYR
ncbi:MAG: hypothetical protein RBR16_11035 [Syntrophus sp. (in: bacteria)]|nr:hypothetical protein [Syntrophus sp. (in: bacteria)]